MFSCQPRTNKRSLIENIALNVCSISLIIVLTYSNRNLGRHAFSWTTLMKALISGPRTVRSVADETHSKFSDVFQNFSRVTRVCDSVVV